MPPSATSTYPLDNAWEHAQSRLRSLERIYDPGSTRRLQALGVGPGWRCLEVGAGGGSITRWLCSKVGAAGRVMAVDLDTRFVADIRAANLDVARLDVATADLPRDTYDLIHARLVLSYVPQREAVLDALVASLRPRGWLLVEEPDEYATVALGSGLHGEMAAKMAAGVSRVGMNPTWARDLPARLHRRGLSDIGAESEVPLIQGGSPTTEFFKLTALQLQGQMVAAGATAGQFDEWSSLLDTPTEWFPCFAVVAAWGRRR
ncbi:MAG: methyltransferase domain-containing protein [Actinobacteria bacterium]|nr:methyltransferase domain-containing protein [Actinomycetota bacterium]